MGQTSYAYDMGRGKEGGIADAGNNQIGSYSAEETIKFGRFVRTGTDPNRQVKLPTAATDITGKPGLGFAIRQGNNEGNVQYSQYDTVNVLMRGQVHVKVEEDMTPNSDVYIRYAAVAQRTLITFAGAIVASNVINMKVNGVALTQVPFNTTSTQTLTDLATQLQALASIATATANGTAKTIAITAASTALDIAITNILVTLGATKTTGVFSVVSDSHPAADIGQVRPDDDNTTAALCSHARIVEGATKGNIAVLAIEIA